MFASRCVQDCLKGRQTRRSLCRSKERFAFGTTAAERLFGYRAADVLNRTCDDVLKGTGALGTTVCTRGCGVQCCALHTDSIPTFDLEVTTSSGQRRWVSVSTIVFEDSRLHRRLIVHLSHDIGKRKESEQAFGQHAGVVETSRVAGRNASCNLRRLRPSRGRRSVSSGSFPNR